MGGLVARWYVEREAGWQITRRLITMGTPYRGAFKALDQLSSGVRPGKWKAQLDLTPVARSMPSMYQLLPEYGASAPICCERPSQPSTVWTRQWSTMP
jgi:hypothetical protein